MGNHHSGVGHPLSAGGNSARQPSASGASFVSGPGSPNSLTASGLPPVQFQSIAGSQHFNHHLGSSNGGTSGQRGTGAGGSTDPDFSSASLDAHPLGPIPDDSPRAAMLTTLRQSWEVLLSTTTPQEAIRKFYMRMLERGDDDLRRLFANTDLDRQSHMLRSVVTWLMTDSMDEDGIKRMAVLHVHLGVRDEQILIFRDCFVETMGNLCGPQWTPAFATAWREAFDAFADAMRPTMQSTRDALNQLTAPQGGVGGDPFAVSVNVNEAIAKDIMAAVHTTSRLTAQNIVFEVRASMEGKVGYSSKRADGTRDYGAPIVRYAELRGRLLYMLRMIDNNTASDVVRRVIDVARVTQVTSAALPDRVIDPNSVDALAPAMQTGSTLLHDAPAGASATSSGSAATAPATTSSGAAPPTKSIAIFEIVLVEHQVAIHRLLVMGETDHEKWVVALRRAVRQFSSAVPAPSVAQVDVDAVLDQKLKFFPQDFQMLTLLGRGSFGKVVKVQHIATGKIYALKVINKTRFESVKNIVEVRREKAILESVRHPFIVGYHGMFQTPTKLYFLFDFLSGGELFYHTQQAPNHHFDEAACRFYLAEMALAIEHLRQLNIIHRDIKGNNFVLDADGHVVLTDFGFAKHNDERTKNKSTCGTLAYIAPEVIAPTGLGYGHEVDWWGLGVVFFTMLTGFFPFLRPKPHLTAKAIACDPLRFPKEPQLSPEAQDLCAKLLTKKPGDRIASLEQLSRHPFYRDWDFDATLAREMHPPFVPDRRGSNTRYFSPKFTQDVAAVVGMSAEDNDGGSSSSERSNNVFGSFYDGAEGHASDNDDDLDDSEMKQAATPAASSARK